MQQPSRVLPATKEGRAIRNGHRHNRQAMAGRVVVVVRQTLSRPHQQLDLTPGEPLPYGTRIGNGLDDGVFDVTTEHEARGDQRAVRGGNLGWRQSLARVGRCT